MTIIDPESVARDWLRRAYRNAAHSPDPSTQTGAVLLDYDGGEVIGDGWNEFPAGVEQTPARLSNRDVKYQLIVHAERAALYDAATRCRRLLGTTLYAPWAACPQCAQSIIELGVTRVVGHRAALDRGKLHPNWAAAVELGLKMLDEAGIEYDLYDGPIGNTPVLRFNYKLWQP